MLPSSILASRLIFGFGSTLALQLRQPYRGSILPSSILTLRLTFWFRLTIASQRWLKSVTEVSMIPPFLFPINLRYREL